MRSSFWPHLIPFFLLALSIYTLTAWQPHARNQQAKTVQESAFFSHIHFRQFNEKGELNTQFSALRLSLLSDKQAFFTKPQFLLITADHSPWTAISDRGKSYNNGEKVELMGSVHLIQSPTPSSPKTDIRTASLTLFPKKNLADTLEPITVDRPGMKISGKGMNADLKKNIFTLKSETKGFYAPNDSEEPFQFQSHSMQYNGKNHIATYRHEVHISKANEKIQGDTILVHTDEHNEIQNLLALGNPAHYQSDPKNNSKALDATAESIHFDAKQNIAILRKNAKVRQGEDTLKGDYVWYDVKQGLAKTKPTSKDGKTIIHLEPKAKIQ